MEWKVKFHINTKLQEKLQPSILKYLRLKIADRKTKILICITENISRTLHDLNFFENKIFDLLPSFPSL
jgi:hypothetical protein